MRHGEIVIDPLLRSVVDLDLWGGRRLERPAKRNRDLRIDFFRGVALACIFIDHIPGNVVAGFTLTNFGFADAAEVFVFLAGYSSVLAYGAALDRDAAVASVRIAKRVRDIYLAHLALAVGCAIALVVASRALAAPSLIEHMRMQVFLDQPLRGGLNALALMYLPTYLDILPLYVVLLAAFPVLWTIMRWNDGLAITMAVVIWAIAGWYQFTMPNVATGSGWTFNPFSWILLYVLGMSVARANVRSWMVGATPDVIFALSACYLLFAFLVAAPWTQFGALHELRMFPDWRQQFDKPYLSVYRVLNMLALACVTSYVLQPRARWFNRGWARTLIACGQHSLPVFCAGIVLSIASLIFLTAVGNTVSMQLLVSCLGLTVMFATGLALDLGSQARTIGRRERVASR